MKRKKASRIGQILSENCCLKHVTERRIEYRIEMRETQGRSCRQPLYDLEETRA
jgi:hypothetical protein